MGVIPITHQIGGVTKIARAGRKFRDRLDC
jgi:hypothetical protein